MTATFEVVTLWSAHDRDSYMGAARVVVDGSVVEVLSSECHLYRRYRLVRREPRGLVVEKESR